MIGVPPYCVHEFSIREVLHYLWPTYFEVAIWVANLYFKKKERYRHVFKLKICVYAACYSRHVR